MIAVTETGGEETFVILHTDGSAEPEYFLDLDIDRPGAIAVNPQKYQIVFSNHRYVIVFLDLPSRKMRVVDRGNDRPFSGFSWSPDGEWVAYSVSVSLQIKILILWHAASGEITSSLLCNVLYRRSLVIVPGFVFFQPLSSACHI